MDVVYNDQLVDHLKLDLPDLFGRLATPLTVPIIVESKSESSEENGGSSNTAYYGLTALVLIPMIAFGYLAYRKRSGYPPDNKSIREQDGGDNRRKQDQESIENNPATHTPEATSTVEATAEAVANDDGNEIPGVKDQCRAAAKRGGDPPMVTAVPMDSCSNVFKQHDAEC